MLRVGSLRFLFGGQKTPAKSGLLESDLQGMLDERVRIRQEIAKKTQ